MSSCSETQSIDDSCDVTGSSSSGQLINVNAQELGLKPGEYIKDVQVKIRAPNVAALKREGGYLEKICTKLNNATLDSKTVELTLVYDTNVSTLQWNTFSGVVNVNGISYLGVNKGIANLPAYAITRSIPIILSGKPTLGMVEINPCNNNHILFYLSLNKGTVNANNGDSFTIYGSNLSWISGC